MREMMTAGEAARFLGVATDTLRRYAERGLVPCYLTPGGHRRYDRDDLVRFADSAKASCREKEVAR